MFADRSALQRLQQENLALKESQGQTGVVGLRTNTEKNISSLDQEEDEEETSVVPVGKRGPPCVGLSHEPGKRHCLRPQSLDLSKSHHRTCKPGMVTTKTVEVCVSLVKVA